MNKKLVIRQNSSKDCGVACLVSIMKYYNVEPPYEEVAYYLRLNKDGTNAYNIINGSKNYGFDGYGIHYTYEEIINNKVILPIICHTIKDNMYHFIVVYKINKNNIEIMDPSSNITKISKEYFKRIYLGVSIVIYQVKKVDKISTHKSLNSFIISYLLIIKKEVIISIIISILIVILNIIINYYLSLLIDTNYKQNIILLITLVFLNLTIFKNIFIYIRENLLIKIENSTLSNINMDIIRKLFNLPYLFFKNKSTGEIESRLNDLSTLRNIFSNILLNICLDFIFVICSFIVLFLINKNLLIICIVEIILYYIITLLFKNKINNNIENLTIYESEYNKFLNECLYGYETNKNISMINNTLKRIEIKYISFIDKINKYRSNKNIDLLIKNIITDILYILLIFIEILYFNKDIITIGKLILFNTICLYFKESIKEIIDFKYNYLYFKTIYKRINDLFVIEKNSEQITNTSIKGNIVIKGLSYSIDGLHNIFNNINLEINYKSKYLIYGESGCGKSTLVKIILKYLNDYKGNIYIDNINLKDINSYVIENSFTYVSQNNYINNDTLKNNIIYDRDISESDYEEVISLCNLDSLRDSKALRNNFMIEENGFNISGGERQKIILARSLLKPCNYLILDEALCEVSEKEEIDIINKIIKKYEEKTIIYISHRKRIIDLFNKKYKLERR